MCVNITRILQIAYGRSHRENLKDFESITTHKIKALY